MNVTVIKVRHVQVFRQLLLAYGIDHRRCALALQALERLLDIGFRLLLCRRGFVEYGLIVLSLCLEGNFAVRQSNILELTGFDRIVDPLVTQYCERPELLRRDLVLLYQLSNLLH